MSSYPHVNLRSSEKLITCKITRRHNQEDHFEDESWLSYLLSKIFELGLFRSSTTVRVAKSGL
jgi:hypothetical protein